MNKRYLFIVLFILLIFSNSLYSQEINLIEEVNNENTINFFGKEISLEDKSLLLNTIIIAFVDGINPCSLWVLFFLLSIIVYSGSRKKIFVIGITFLTVTALIYGLFILSVLNALIFLYNPFIKALIVITAVFFGLINIKDYFWYKKGISLTISDKYKPKMFDRIRNLMNPKNSFFTIFIGTVILAAGITIVEIPCTAGLPILWANMIATSAVSSANYYFLLAVYIFVYLLNEIILFIIAIYTLRIGKMKEKHGKILKLFSGLLIFNIGIAFLFFENIIQGLFGMIILLGTSLFLTWIIHVIYVRFKK